MKVQSIYPADDFNNVLQNSMDNYEFAIIIGYDNNGYLDVMGGGMNSGARPTAKDWLFLVECFKAKLVNGDYVDNIE